MANPYAPPEPLAEVERGVCPICGQRVAYLRYVLPFGICPHCRNYLTTRTEQDPLAAWPAVVITLLAIPTLLHQFDLIDYSVPFMPAVFVVLGCRWVHEKCIGKLVPAIMWGFAALADDDRVTSNSAADEESKQPET